MYDLWLSKSRSRRHSVRQITVIGGTRYFTTTTSKWKRAFRVPLLENFREQRNIWKGGPVFPDEIFQTNIRVTFVIKRIFDTSFRPSRLFFGKWNWFVKQIVNPIPEWNLLGLNFSNHSPNTWTDRSFTTLETTRELELKCVPQLFLGLLLGTRQSAIGQFFFLSLVTVP